jgi:hypothetical protein
MIDKATAVQISHCGTSSLTVFITVWNMPCAFETHDLVGAKRVPRGTHGRRHMARARTSYPRSHVGPRCLLSPHMTRRTSGTEASAG